MTGSFIALAGLIVFVAAFVQGVTGFGFALISAPALSLIDPTLLPTLILALMVPLNLYVAWRERHALDLNDAAWIMTGRIAGTGGGLWLLFSIPVASLSALIGASTILAASATMIAPAFKPSGRALLAVGAIVGVTETATGIGGPPLALAYQHRPASVLRSTVAICFLLGEVISLVLLAALGRIHADQVRAAFLLLPLLGIGALLSSVIHHRIDGPLIRTIVLGFALLSGVAATIHGL